MAITKGRAIDEMLRWLDEATVNGAAPATEQLSDYKNRAAYLLDGVLKLLAGQFKIPASFTVVRSPVDNLLGAGEVAATVRADKPYEAKALGAKSFYIEVRGDVTVTILSGGSTLRTETICSDTAFSPVKGNITGASGEVTMRVSSDYPADVRYPAMYGVAFSYDDTVEEYRPFIPYLLPEDFREYEKCVHTHDGQTCRDYDNVRREGLRTFLLPYSARGQFTFHYWRNPQTIASDAADDTVLEIAPEAEQLIGLKLAADITRGSLDTQNISYWLDAEFAARVNNLAREPRGGRTVIQTVYGMD